MAAISAARLYFYALARGQSAEDAQQREKRFVSTDSKKDFCGIAHGTDRDIESRK